MNNIDDISVQLKALNHLYMRQDKIYHRFAQNAGLSDSAFWILYTMFESGGPITQIGFCEACFISKQTINSSINVLIKKGYVILEPIAGTKNSKSVSLTDDGILFCREHIQPVLNAERTAFENLTEAERKTFITLMERQLNYLNEAATTEKE